MATQIITVSENLLNYINNRSDGERVTGILKKVLDENNKNSITPKEIYILGSGISSAVTHAFNSFMLKDEKNTDYFLKIYLEITALEEALLNYMK